MARVVLVVDDDVDTRNAVADLLEAEGFTPVIASNGEQALKLIHGGLRPCAIALDLQMPGVDGETFLHLCSSVLPKPCTIIVMSGLSEVAHVRERGDVKYVLQKPFEPDRLVELVKHACP